MNECGDLGVVFGAMNWIEGWDREQEHLLPPRLEDYVDENNPARFLDAFVDGLDLRGKGFKFPKCNAHGKGRPSYHPAGLLKLYLYGYLNGIRSTRKLENECRRNLEVMWLLRQLAPDFKTIADFRRDNADAFKEVTREFTRLCQQLGLFGCQLLAVDGTKIKGQNARDQNWGRSKLQKQLELAQKKVEEYLQTLDQADAQEAQTGEKVVNWKAKLEKWQQIQSKAQERLDALAASGESQYSVTDADSRGMKGSYGHMVGYNVQGAVDAKHHLLAVLEATNDPVDQGHLAPVVQTAKEELQIKQADVTADGGYFKNDDIKACQEMGMEPHIPEPVAPAKFYGKDKFNYIVETNTYTCPAGQTLKFRHRVQDKGTIRFNYQNAAACAQCALRTHCTGSNYRVVSRWENDHCIERMKQRMAADPQKLTKRKTLIEHTWGTIKHLLPGGFLLKGLKKVAAEVSLVHFAYNLKRAMATIDLGNMISTCRKIANAPKTA